MKTRNLSLLAAALIMGLTATTATYARGGHGGHGGHFRGGGFHHGGARVGVFIGAPLFAYGYGYRPYYPYYPPAYYPYAVPAPVVVQPATPPVYVERSDEQAAAPPADYWYYCPDTKTYYPYVGSCASPWQRVAPQTPQS
jgi:hypothetical protein